MPHGSLQEYNTQVFLRQSQICFFLESCHMYKLVTHAYECSTKGIPVVMIHFFFVIFFDVTFFVWVTSQMWISHAKPMNVCICACLCMSGYVCICVGNDIYADGRAIQRRAAKHTRHFTCVRVCAFVRVCIYACLCMSVYVCICVDTGI